MLSASVKPVRARPFDQGVPSVLRPVLRAYVLGYASSTAPRVLTLLLLHLSRRRKNIDPKPEDKFLPSLLRILRGGLELQRFPTFCAALVGGSTLLEARDTPPFHISLLSLGSDSITEIICTSGIVSIKISAVEVRDLSPALFCLHS